MEAKQRLLKDNFLYFVVFLTGAAVLIIEVTAVRILAPFFGTTIFTISSIVGVILGALSLGYFFGGSLADKNPSYRYFFLIITFSGIFTIFIDVLLKILFPLPYILDFKLGPVLLSLILLFSPSFLLGMVSPFAIRLKVWQVETSGNISGKIFAISTIGSIFGSFFTGFFLIPNFGVSKIIFGTGTFLFILGILGLYLFSPKKKFLEKEEKRFLLFLFLPIFIYFFYHPNFIPIEGFRRIIFEKDGLYQKIIVFEREEKGKIQNVLMLDRGLHSAIFLDSDDFVFDYAHSLKLYKFLNPKIKSVLFLGGGAFTMPRWLLLENKEIEKVDVVEIEPGLEKLAKKYFRLFNDKRLKIFSLDGRRFLNDTNSTYDLIFVDVASSEFLPPHFSTKEFFSLLKERLNPDGFLFMSVLGSLKEGKDEFLLALMKTFKSIFENSYFFKTKEENKKLTNFIFLGINNEKHYNFNEALKDLPIFLVFVEERKLKKAPILTDDFAPVEYLFAKSI